MEEGASDCERWRGGSADVERGGAVLEEEDEPNRFKTGKEDSACTCEKLGGGTLHVVEAGVKVGKGEGAREGREGFMIG